MIRLGVNLDHIATVRQARLERYPCPIQSAAFAELGGADNITCHLREDRRHIQDRDVKMLKEIINIPLNFEIANTAEMIKFAIDLHPAHITLVPEKREELTTEGGLNLENNPSSFRSSIEALREQSISVSLFIEPTKESVDLSKQLNASAVEFHTGSFCKQMDRTFDPHERMLLIDHLNEVTEHAYKLGLGVHLGHGLNYRNAHWLQLVSYAEEANIGHSIISRALLIGLQGAVKEMKELLNHSKHRPYWIPKDER